MYIFCLICELEFQVFASSRLSCSCHCKLDCFVLVYRFLEDVRELKSKVVLCLVTQLCPILCDTMNCSLPGSSVHGIPQAGILELVVIPLSRGSSWPRDQTWVSCIAGRFFTVWVTRDIQKSEESDQSAATLYCMAISATPVPSSFRNPSFLSPRSLHQLLSGEWAQRELFTRHLVILRNHVKYFHASMPLLMLLLLPQIPST